MKRTEESRRRSETTSGLDATLRSALTPEEATVDRLVQGALAENEASPAPHRTWRRLTVAAVAVLAAIAIPRLLLTTAPGPPPQDVPAPLQGSDAHTPAPGPASLRISNEDGPVTVTTTAGSKMVFLSLAFEETVPGDDS